MIALEALAELAGIQTAYHDVWGKEHKVPEASLCAILDAMGFPCATEEERAQSHARLAERYKTVLPPVKIIPADKTVSILVRGALRWELRDEQGGRLHGGDAKRERIPLPSLNMGYYSLQVFFHDKILTSTVIAAPAQCWMPEEMKRGKRVWGIATQLYAMRSQQNMGMGDFGDLQQLARDAAPYGCDGVGLNPVHAMFPANAGAYSPYAPSNRLFLNLLYIDIRAIDNFAACKAAQRVLNDPAFQSKLDSARMQEWVDYASVSELKFRLLALLFDDFWQNTDKERYHSFCEGQGEALYFQALFDALSSHFGTHWQAWPEAYHDPHGGEVKAFARAHPREIEYYRWLQFIADAQLAKAQAAALQAGMKIGLYRDLAVGPEGAGAEIWLGAAHFIKGVSVGAPPDEYNTKGQNWGLPAFHPFILQDQGLGPFIRLVRVNMRHARALRIDHAFGLSRLYLIPQGMEAGDGAFLNYPFDAMLAVLRLESHRNQCIVIGEDLGPFPAGYKEKAAASGLFSYKLLLFERDAHQFTPPAYYAPRALATFSTHDLPTLRGWLTSADLEERGKLSLYPSGELKAKDRESRPRDIALLKEALAKEQLGELDNNAVQRYLARSPAAIVMLQLEDLLGITPQANLPATTTERPNWRMKLPQPLEDILAPQGPLAAISGSMNAERSQPLIHPPRATYRLQLHKDFTFYDAANIVPYLAELGISHVYFSPYLQARPGSTHGYDITNHNHLNPELGGEEGFAQLTEALKRCGLRQILDFVPNHMGVGSGNSWWMSVLEWGKESPYADYFDIDWQPRYGQSEHKLLLPVLGRHYGDALEAGELSVAFEPQEGGFYIHYFTDRYPICPRDYKAIAPELGSVSAFKNAKAYKTALAHECSLHDRLANAARKLSEDKETLHGLLERQHYRLAFWRVAASEINYRRFFDINELAGMRPELPEVFDAMHELVLSLIAKGHLHGLRIDHIDGLADPAAYCHRLKEKAGAGLYLTVEKILATHENLRKEWNIQGTSGYDALNQLAGLFVQGKNEALMEECYRRFTASDARFTDMVFNAKCAILESSLASELLSLSLSLKRVAENRYNRDYTLDLLRQALKEIIGWFPVYRTYVSQGQTTAEDIDAIDWACGRAKKQSLLTDTSVYDYIAHLLKCEDDAPNDTLLTFIRKFQQLSGPVMAKGLEDTSFYRFNRLLSLNEVGGDPARFGLTAKAFHRMNEQRMQEFPHTMLATATHDTKRGEDARCRISVLSHVPERWKEWVTRCATFNRSYRSEIEGDIAPSANEEYALYQTLLGSWPVELLEEPLDSSMLAEYTERITAYLTKALREAKEHSNWTHPREAYENAVHSFARAILDNSKPNKFLEVFLPFAREVAHAGSILSLAQLTLKLTMPGVPDIYQGTEYWDVSLVDPDNRRPVDYAIRHATLSADAPLPQLWPNWQSGAVKQQLLRCLLKLRNQQADMFAYGDYTAIPVTGENAQDYLAFARSHHDKALYVIVPVTPFAGEKAKAAIDLPQGNYQNLFTGDILQGGLISLDTLFRTFPVAALWRLTN